MMLFVPVVPLPAAMAQASLASDFSCSVCLELLRDPVTVPCGHSYCRKCLTDYWDHQQASICPQCRATFSPRPELGRNVMLAEMMEKLGAVRLSGGPSAPPMHDVFQSPSDHQGFQHATFDVSSVHPERNEGQRLVGETRRRIAAQLKEKEKEVHQLRTSQRSFSHVAKAAVKDSSRIFLELMDFLERRRMEVKELIRAHQKAEHTRAENHVQHLERQMSELKRRDAELERLSQVQDHNLMAQMCQSLSGPLVPAGTGSLTVSPSVSFGPVRGVLSDLREQLQSLYQSHFPNVTSAVKSISLLQMERTAEEVCVPASIPAVHSRDDLMPYFSQLSLDPFTAHREIFLSRGNRTATRTGQVQSYLDHPDRFDSWVQVLCREALQGRSYWEAEWDGQVVLGLAFEDIGRKGSSDACRLGYNALSWTLQCGASSLAFCHDKQPQEVELPAAWAAGCRVGVFLDHDAGVLCFYAVAPSELRLLHRAVAAFGRPLHPAAWLGNRSAVTFCAVDSLSAAV